jgi:hypothetical protein
MQVKTAKIIEIIIVIINIVLLCLFVCVRCFLLVLTLQLASELLSLHVNKCN